MKRGFCGGRPCRPPQNPSLIPLPSPAVRERGGARGGVRTPAAGERERSTNDSEISMNLGAGGGVRAKSCLERLSERVRFFETWARYDFKGLNRFHFFALFAVFQLHKVEILGRDGGEGPHRGLAEAPLGVE